jgi:hypothetical protein
VEARLHPTHRLALCPDMSRTSEGTADIAINQNDPTPGTYTLTEDVYELHTTATAPDPNWTHTDNHGHWHAYTDDGKLPTLTTAVLHQPCDGTDHPGAIAEEPCPGYNTTELHCRICNERVHPIRIATPHPTLVVVPRAWTAQLTHPDPDHTYRTPSDVIARLHTPDGRTLFGTARATLTDIHPDGHITLTLTGTGTLGTRPRHPRNAAEIKAAATAANTARTELQKLLTASCPGHHRYIQHRDGKPPWCPSCHYTPDGTPTGPRTR